MLRAFVTPEQYRKFEKLAKQEKRSVSGLTTVLVVEALESRKKQA